MKKAEKFAKRAKQLFAVTALKAGIASSNSACRFGYYQNPIPSAIAKFKK